MQDELQIIVERGAYDARTILAALRSLSESHKPIFADPKIYDDLWEARTSLDAILKDAPRA